MYVMLCTRPDICFVVGLVSRFQSNPGVKHWEAVKRIMRYLKGTMDYELCYRGRSLHLEGYSDADWAGDLDERHSTSGYAYLLNNGAISWSSKKQTCVSLSSMEAEYVACAAAVQEAVWLKRFLERLGINGMKKDPILIHCDSEAAIAYAKDPKDHKRTKHIDIKYHFIRDMISKKQVTVRYLSTHKMLADPLTKPIARDVFVKHVKALGMSNI